MRIVVLVKEVPDTYGDRKLSLVTGLADRGASETVLDEIGERSLEVALSYADKHPDAEVVVMSMSPEGSAATVRKALAMGASSAVHIADEGLVGADLGLTAEVLAAALQRTGFDLVIGGNLSTDGSGGVLPSMVAELLDASDGATMRVTAQLPAVVSITERLPDARFPNFKGIMAAKKKPFETLTLADLAVEAEDHSASRSIVIGLSEKPPRSAGVKITDEGDAGEKLADFLIQNRLA
jgi:electron transfer flavoprotein beta subunit